MTSRTKVLLAVGVAAAVAIGGTIAMSAASATTAQGSASIASGSTGSDTTTQGSTAAQVPAAPGTGVAGGLGGREFGLLLGALHGDFVVAASSGSGTVTERLQRGQVTAVGLGSLTVRSTDGYTSTYTVPADLDVSGISSGATVLVIGTVNGNTVTAGLISDGTMPGGGFGTGGVPGGGVPDGSGSGRGTGLPQTTSSAPTTA